MQEIKPLLVFAHLLKHGSMQATGKALGISASAVSQHISRLEAEHNVKLINRSTRSLVPTEIGRELGEYCSKLLYAVNDTLSALENIKTDARGTVNIALASGMVNNPCFQQTLSDLLQNHPAIHIQLHCSDRLMNLQEGHFDIALRGGEHALDDPNLVAHHLLQTPWRIVATPDYLREHPIEQPSDLLAQCWFAFRPINYLMQKGQASFHLRIENAVQCDQVLAQQAFIRQGLGLGVILPTDLTALIAQDELQIVLPDWTLPNVDLYAVTPYRVQSAKVGVVLNLLKKYFRKAD